jgi:hypothetical protein
MGYGCVASHLCGQRNIAPSTKFFKLHYPKGDCQH